MQLAIPSLLLSAMQTPWASHPCPLALGQQKLRTPWANHARPYALGRRDLLHSAAAAATVMLQASSAAAVKIDLTMDLSGLRWADLRQGSLSMGPKPQAGQAVTIDYMMTRQAGAKIHSTKDAKQPFSWTLGDGTVIKGLEMAILGEGGIPPMLPGGVRRVLIPQPLGYGSNRGLFKNGEAEVKNLLPIPPEGFVWVDSRGDRVNSYERFKDTYMNEMRLDEPGLIMDIILLPQSAPSSAAATSSPEPATP